MDTKNTMPESPADQLLRNFDIIRDLHLVPVWQCSSELASLLVALRVRAESDPSLRISLDSLAEKIIAAQTDAEQAEQRLAA